jgi:tRNA A-37 threonylcarbamoyl transferase component Bud32
MAGAHFGAQRWREVAPHLDHALGLGEPERADWLRAVRTRDPALADDLQQLLDEHRALAQAGFLENAVAELGRPGDGRGPGGTRLEPGARLAERYRIVRLIARGGMGEVYEAEDLALGIRIALKVIRADRGEQAALRERFRREIQLARTITHPNVCRVFDLGQHDAGDEPLTFLTMELLAGETLAERLAREGPLSAAEVKALVPQLLQALGAAHAAGVVHRDFKSGNIILTLTEGGLRAVVTDFGLAKSFAAAPDETGISIVGTPAYMAPEQLHGGAITPAVDIYAFGVVLFELLGGRRPFAPATADRSWRETSPPSAEPTRLPPSLESRWGPIIRKCLQPMPGDRFGSVEEISRALTTRRRRWALVLAGTLVSAGSVAAVLARPASVAPGRSTRGGSTAAVVSPGAGPRVSAPPARAPAVPGPTPPAGPAGQPQTQAGPRKTRVRSRPRPSGTAAPTGLAAPAPAAASPDAADQTPPKGPAQPEPRRWLRPRRW